MYADCEKASSYVYTIAKDIYIYIYHKLFINYLS